MSVKRLLLVLLTAFVAISGGAVATEDSVRLKKLVAHLREFEGCITLREMPSGRSDGQPDTQLSSKRETLKKLCAAGPEAIAPLIQAMNDPAHQMRSNVCQVFSELAYANSKQGKCSNAMHVALLEAGIEAAKSPYADVRQSASSFILETGAPFDKSVPVLVQLTRDSSANVRTSAALYLGMMLGAEKTLAAKNVSSLELLLADRSAAVRNAAARGFFELGLPVASGSLPAIKKLLKDPDKNVREQAKTTIEALTRKERIPRR